MDHLNGAGLLWRISGGKITSMETDWATIEINGGSASSLQPGRFMGHCASGAGSSAFPNWDTCSGR